MKLKRTLALLLAMSMLLSTAAFADEGNTPIEGGSQVENTVPQDPATQENALNDGENNAQPDGALPEGEAPDAEGADNALPAQDPQPGQPEGEPAAQADETEEVTAPAAKIGEVGYATLQEAINAAEGETVIILQKDVTESVTVPAGKNITLNLNGNTLTAAATHAITNNGTLTVTGMGTVSGGAVSGAGAIFNNVGATADLESGFFTGSKWYVIKNLGTMTINGARVTQGDAGSSGIDNGWYDGGSATGVGNDCGVAHRSGQTASLTIKGGNLSGGINTVKNDDYGVLTIEDGAFSNTTQHVIMNHNVATITGGTFTAEHGKQAVWNTSAHTDANQGSLVISGGTFTETGDSVTPYLTDTVKLAGKTVLPLNEKDPETVATVGNAYYKSLQAAIGAAGVGQTVTLVKTVELDEGLTITKAVKIDLDGKTLKVNGNIIFSDVTGCEVRNGSIEVGTVAALNGSFALDQVNLTANGTFAIQLGTAKQVWGSAEITDCTIEKTGTGHGAAIGIYGPYANKEKMGDLCSVLKVEGTTTITGSSWGIMGNGAAHGTLIELGKNVTIKANGGYSDWNGDKKTVLGSSGIYHPQEGKLETSADISGIYSGIEMRAGELVVNGGEITATSETFNCHPNGSGMTTQGAAIAIAQHTTKRDIKVTINGGTFTGKKALSESNPQANDPAPQVTLSVTGGTFLGEVTAVDVAGFVTGGEFSTTINPELLAPGLALDNCESGIYYKVTADKDTVATIQDADNKYVRGYENLQDALNAAASGQTVVLQKDITVDYSGLENHAAIVIPDGVRLNGNGKTIKAGSFTTNGHVVGVNGGQNVFISNLTIEGTGKDSTVGKHCLNVYGGAQVSLTGVTLKNARTAGLVINGSTVGANSLTTDGNGWGGVNVDNGSKFAIDSLDRLNEASKVWSEDYGAEGGSTVTITAENAVTVYGIDEGKTHFTTKAAAQANEKVIAQVDGAYYGSLQAAVDAAQPGGTVTLLRNATGSGVIVNKSVTIDFAGHSYTVGKAPLAGSGDKYATQGFQLLAGSNKLKPNTVTMKNGAIVLPSDTPNLMMGIQNYTNLTLSGMTLDASENGNITYVVSNNNGATTITGGTVIKAAEGKVAFDVYDYSSNGYGNVSVTVDDADITGAIEVSDSQKAKLTITGGTFSFDVSAYCVEGFKAAEGENGKWSIVAKDYVAQVGEVKYESLQEAVNVGGEVKLLKDVTVTEPISVTKAITLDGSGRTITGGVHVDGKGNTPGLVVTLKGLTVDSLLVESAIVYADGLAIQEEGNGVTVRQGFFSDSIQGGYTSQKAIRADADSAVSVDGFVPVYGMEDGLVHYMTEGKAREVSQARVGENTKSKYFVSLADAVAAVNTSGNKTALYLLKDCVSEALTITQDWVTVTGSQAQGGRAQLTGQLLIQSNNVQINNLKVTADNAVAMTAENIKDLSMINVELKGGLVLSNAANARLNTVTVSDAATAGVRITAGSTVIAVDLQTSGEGKIEVVVDGRSSFTYQSGNLSEIRQDDQNSDVIVPAGWTHYTAVKDGETRTFYTTNMAPISLNYHELSMSVGYTISTPMPLQVSGAPEGAQVVWSTTDDKVATVDQAGKVTPVGAGTAAIIATVGSMTDRCQVSVTEIVPTVTLDRTGATLTVGGTVTLTATVTPEAAQGQVAWSSSDPSVATVDRNGQVTAVAAGTAVITATVGTVTATCAVTVERPVNPDPGPGPVNPDPGPVGPVDPNPGPVGPVDPNPNPNQGEEQLGENDTPLIQRPFLFTDVKEGKWYYSAVKTMFDKGLINGMTETTFEPFATSNRAMVATMLYRMAGSPSVKDVETTISDVSARVWFHDAAVWAFDVGVFNGYKDGSFRGGEDITREQLAAVLRRYAAAQGVDVSAQAGLDGFVDAGQVSKWAVEDMKWAVAVGLITGRSGSQLAAKDSANRAELATMMVRFDALLTNAKKPETEKTAQSVG